MSTETSVWKTDSNPEERLYSSDKAERGEYDLKWLNFEYILS